MRPARERGCARGTARISLQDRSPVSETPAARSELAQRARNRGCRFLWLLSFGQAKESDPLAGMRPEHARRRVGLRDNANENQRQNQNGFRLSPERRKKIWIPAFAGITREPTRTTTIA